MGGYSNLSVSPKFWVSDNSDNAGFFRIFANSDQ